MVIVELIEKEFAAENIKLNRIYMQFKELLKQLKQRELPPNIIEILNNDLEEMNATSFNDKELMRLFKKKQTKILKLLEKELKIVPKDYYKSYWLPLGMTIFGIPIGIAFGAIVLNNSALFPIGFPIGMAIGIAIGIKMDKNALKEGRQLDIKIKY